MGLKGKVILLNLGFRLAGIGEDLSLPLGLLCKVNQFIRDRAPLTTTAAQMSPGDRMSQCLD